MITWYDTDMTLPLGEDPTRGKPARHEVVTTTTFKLKDGDQYGPATGFVTSALEANGEFSRVSVEYVNQGTTHQYRLFTAHRFYEGSLSPASGVDESSRTLVRIMQRNGVEVQVVQVYGRLVTHGKI